MNYIRKRALAGEFLAGGWSSLASPTSVEITASVGFDWILVDQEHGAGGNWNLLHQAQAASRFSSSVIVRVPWLDRTLIRRTLDIGVGGIMVPSVNNAKEAADAVRFAKYPPDGERGTASSSRCGTYGSRFMDYFAEANENLLTIVQVETGESVENAESIAAVPGVDVLFLGPLDLAVDTGLREQYKDPAFMAMLEKVGTAARKHGKAAGILLPDAGMISLFKKLGYTFIACGTDTGAVLAAMRGSLKSLHEPG